MPPACLLLHHGNVSSPLYAWKHLVRNITTRPGHHPLNHGSPPGSTTMTVLLDNESVASKKALYTRAIDTAQWSLLDTNLPLDFSFRMLDLDGHTLSLGGVQIRFPTKAAWLTHFRELLEAKQSTHLVRISKRTPGTCRPLS